MIISKRIDTIKLNPKSEYTLYFKKLQSFIDTLSEEETKKIFCDISCDDRSWVPVFIVAHKISDNIDEINIIFTDENTFIINTSAVNKAKNDLMKYYRYVYKEIKNV